MKKKAFHLFFQGKDFSWLKRTKIYLDWWLPALENCDCWTDNNGLELFFKKGGHPK